jgi:hypothetical protein
MTLTPVGVDPIRFEPGDQRAEAGDDDGPRLVCTCVGGAGAFASLASYRSSLGGATRLVAPWNRGEECLGVWDIDTGRRLAALPGPVGIFKCLVTYALPIKGEARIAAGYVQAS